ncbi:MAG: class I SAM-dependent methyltransferase [Pseudomonadota bacterium]
MEPSRHKIIAKLISEKVNIDESFEQKHLTHLERQCVPADYNFNGLKIHCPSEVYHPDLGSSSLFFISQVFRLGIPEGSSVLEIGTGCGIVILALAQRLRHGVFHASDCSTAAVRSARQNAELNALNVTVFQSNLFDNIPGRKYDYILFNPPLLDRPTEDKVDLEMMSDPGGRTVEKFIADSSTYLSKNGRIYIIQSNYGDTSCIAQHAGKYRWRGCEMSPSGTTRAVLEIIV